MQPATAFLIGNGPARQVIDLNQLKGKGTTFGCNALYRDFDADYVITFGLEMNDEVFFSGFPVHRHLVCPFYEMQERPGGQFVNNCMSAAMLHAGLKRFQTAYILGVDSLFGSVANVYHGKKGYENRPKLDSDGFKLRMASFAYVAGRFKETAFVFLLPQKEKSMYMIPGSNIKGMFYSSLAETFGFELVA